MFPLLLHAQQEDDHAYFLLTKQTMDKLGLYARLEELKDPALDIVGPYFDLLSHRDSTKLKTRIENYTAEEVCILEEYNLLTGSYNIYEYYVIGNGRYIYYENDSFGGSHQDSLVLDYFDWFRNNHEHTAVLNAIHPKKTEGLIYPLYNSAHLEENLLKFLQLRDKMAKTGRIIYRLSTIYNKKTGDAVTAFEVFLED